MGVFYCKLSDEIREDAGTFRDEGSGIDENRICGKGTGSFCVAI